MSIPVAFQQFKSAGIYRVVYDKSTILSQDTQIMRLVVGYSAQGPFNTPVLVRSISEFKALYGDSSKSLEKRGVYFHRLAKQALLEGPIICLNLKRFAGETVDAANIDTSINAETPIDVVKLNVEDIYDTTRFWELSAFKLAEIKDTTGKALDGYISISATNVKNTSCTFFIRKASGNKVSAYDVTVSDWYNDSGDEIPEYLQDKLNSKISDFFAEIYIFKGQFTPDQVMTSETLKNYFLPDGKDGLKLKQCVYNAYGDAVDTLDALYNDSTSGALNHYVGALIPYFKDKTGVYRALDIQMNNDVDTNNLMMNFNVDLLDDGTANIDLSGRYSIGSNTGLTVEDIYKGDGVTTVLGNSSAPVIADEIKINVEYTQVENSETDKRIYGNYYISDIVKPVAAASETVETPGKITLTDLKDGTTTKTVVVTNDKFEAALKKFGITETEGKYSGELYKEGVNVKNYIVPYSVITVLNYETNTNGNIQYTDNISMTTVPVYIMPSATQINKSVEPVYGSSVTFIPLDDYKKDEKAEVVTYVSTDKASLASLFAVGDCLLGNEQKNELYTNVFVQEVGNKLTDDGKTEYYVKFTGEPLVFTEDKGTIKKLVRIDAPLNQEIGVMSPTYLEGYTYNNPKPASTSMYDKQKWQDFILSTLTDYKGIRTGLLNKADIDYRYVIDTFETYVTSSAKSVLSYLCREKESAFAILNFPSIRTFVKCPYTSFTDSKGIFNIEYIVKGYNPKKPHTVGFSLPSESEGASFCAFYTPLKFTDGYVDSLIPSAALVSNLFINKYRSRQPYYIIAGPNYGAISASGMTGPDYNFSREELNIIEPYGVNCMVYRPGFGTFINANQTAKQTPKSALSSVNVRELVIYLQDEIEKLLQSYQWEFNNETVRNKIKDKADVICSRIQHNGGIQDFVNIMDESNNTPEIIDNEMAVLSTHIEPGRGMGKMIHELTLYRTGQMRAAISEA